jgi:signal recognition particle receptor subunit beta
MAVLDTASNVVVIRVVYDGAPMAGKTTSVRALGQSLGAAVTSPEEIGGRTLYFDWLDYTGGLFEGHRIRCQIVSVPGQASLAPRRRRLLESADVVVFVGDSSPAGFASDKGFLGSLLAALRSGSGPPAGVVLQANKRDLPDAVPLEAMRDMMDALGSKVAIVESVATEGSGVRQAFVFAVRLALDRVRELLRQGRLQSGRADIDSAEELLADMRREDGGALTLATQSGLTHTRLNDVAPSSMAVEAFDQVLRSQDSGQITNGAAPESRSDATLRQPLLPDEHVASGMVWPPVEGRIILQELRQSGVSLRRLDDGGWSGNSAKKWHLYAPSNMVFPTLDGGRRALIALAQVLSTRCRADAIERCAVLADDGMGGMRLWRIKRVVEHGATSSTRS